MNEDLLSNDFSKNVDLEKIKNNINLIKAVLIIGSITSAVILLRWMAMFSNNLFSNNVLTSNMKIYYVVSFCSSLSYTILFIFSWTNYLKANKLIKASFVENNADTFNKAYSLINITTTLTIVGYCITLIEIMTSFLI
jgi:hypothetical protein